MLSSNSITYLSSYHTTTLESINIYPWSWGPWCLNPHNGSGLQVYPEFKAPALTTIVYWHIEAHFSVYYILLLYIHISFIWTFCEPFHLYELFPSKSCARYYRTTKINETPSLSMRIGGGDGSGFNICPINSGVFSSPLTVKGSARTGVCETSMCWEVERQLVGPHYLSAPQ